MHENSPRVCVPKQTMTMVLAILSASLMVSASGALLSRTATRSASHRPHRTRSRRCPPTSRSHRGWSVRPASRWVRLFRPRGIDGSARRTAATGRRR